VSKCPGLATVEAYFLLILNALLSTLNDIFIKKTYNSGSKVMRNCIISQKITCGTKKNNPMNGFSITFLIKLNFFN